MDKILRYKKYLDKYKNCPPEDCIERDILCYRWAHKECTENDFLPQPLMTPPRILDNSDLKCKNFCLSMYIDLKSSKDNFLLQYSRRKQSIKDNLAETFINDVGDHTVRLNLSKCDGISDSPNKKGHFSFHPYEDAKLLENILDTFDNFA